jgi:hypothetical protein
MVAVVGHRRNAQTAFEDLAYSVISGEGEEKETNNNNGVPTSSKRRVSIAAGLSSATPGSSKFADGYDESSSVKASRSSSRLNKEEAEVEAPTPLDLSSKRGVGGAIAPSSSAKNKGGRPPRSSTRGGKGGAGEEEAPLEAAPAAAAPVDSVIMKVPCPALTCLLLFKSYFICLF